MMKSGCLSLLFLAILTACNSVQGTIEIKKSFTYENKASDTLIEYCRHHPDDFYCKGVDTDNRSVTFVPGRYAAELSFSSARDAMLTIDYKSGNSSKTSLRFSMPQGQSFPRYEGDVSIPASQIGQAYDMKGTVHTEESDTADQEGMESCTYYTQEQVCRWVNYPGNGNQPPHHEYVCQWEQVAHPGQQQVQYHYHTSTTHFNMGLYTPNRPEQLADFYGDSTSTNKVYTYQSQCY